MDPGLGLKKDGRKGEDRGAIGKNTDSGVETSEKHGGGHPQGRL